MAHRNTHHAFISPLSPTIHFLLFLVAGLLVIVAVAFAFRQSSFAAKNKMCSQSQTDQETVIETVSKSCPDGIVMSVDALGCKNWVCEELKIPLPSGMSPETSTKKKLY